MFDFIRAFGEIVFGLLCLAICIMLLIGLAIEGYDKMTGADEKRQQQDAALKKLLED